MGWPILHCFWTGVPAPAQCCHPVNIRCTIRNMSANIQATDAIFCYFVTHICGFHLTDPHIRQRHTTTGIYCHIVGLKQQNCESPAPREMTHNDDGEHSQQQLSKCRSDRASAIYTWPSEACASVSAAAHLSCRMYPSIPTGHRI